MGKQCTQLSLPERNYLQAQLELGFRAAAIAAALKRARGRDRRGQISSMISTHERPSEIEARLVPGRWKGDTIKGKDNCSAAAALAGFSRVLDRIEAQARLSIACDRGKRMAQHEVLIKQTGVTIRFA
jgi:IS30 family transposase